MPLAVSIATSRCGDLIPLLTIIIKNVGHSNLALELLTTLTPPKLKREQMKKFGKSKWTILRLNDKTWTDQKPKRF